MIATAHGDAAREATTAVLRQLGAADDRNSDGRKY
jgi:hypothetical protein